MQQKRSKKLREADNFRATVQRLQLHGESLRDWELDWLDSEARRHADYIYTDKERVILNQIAAATQTFEGYNGWPVAELITLAYQYRADLDLGDEEFIEQLNHRRPRTLPVRQLCRLVDIARLSEHIAKDQVVEDTLAQTRLRDEAVYELLA